MNESCHVRMRHVTYEWGMSHMNEACHVWISHSHVNEACHIYEWGMSHMNESCNIWISHVTYGWIVSHMNESCHRWMSHATDEWIVSHINQSCSTSYYQGREVCSPVVLKQHWRASISRVKYEWVVSHINESCHIWMSHVTYEWVMPHLNESCRIKTSHVRNTCCPVTILTSSCKSIPWLHTTSTKFCANDTPETQCDRPKFNVAHPLNIASTPLCTFQTCAVATANAWNKSTKNVRYTWSCGMLCCSHWTFGICMSGRVARETSSEGVRLYAYTINSHTLWNHIHRFVYINHESTYARNIIRGYVKIYIHTLWIRMHMYIHTYLHIHSCTSPGRGVRETSCRTQRHSCGACKLQHAFSAESPFCHPSAVPYHSSHCHAY